MFEINPFAGKETMFCIGLSIGTKIITLHRLCRFLLFNPNKQSKENLAIQNIKTVNN